MAKVVDPELLKMLKQCKLRSRNFVLVVKSANAAGLFLSKKRSSLYWHKAPGESSCLGISRIFGRPNKERSRFDGTQRFAEPNKG